MRSTAHHDLENPDYALRVRTPSGRPPVNAQEKPTSAKMWDCRCRLHGRHFILARDAQAAHAIALSQGLRPDAMFPLPAHIQPVFGEQTCIKA